MCWKPQGITVPFFMDDNIFEASDDEPPVPGPSRADVSAGGAALPAKLKFLNQPCECKKRVCYQQFVLQASAVAHKREEFQALPPHEKARDTESVNMFDKLFDPESCLQNVPHSNSV